MKFNYASLEEVPKNVWNFFIDTNTFVVPDAIDLVSVEDVNEFFNDLNSWYEMHQMNIEDFING